MSAAASLALEKAERRVVPRYPINTVLDVIALRSGVPENLPGRCTDLSETGVGAMVAGQLNVGQQVAVELRLAHVGVPVRARAIVRYQGRLHYGFEFVGLAIEQREMIRYWACRLPKHSSEPEPAKTTPAEEDLVTVVVPSVGGTNAGRLPLGPKVRIRRQRFNLLLAVMLLLAVAGWWQWQRSWNELEAEASAAKHAPLRVPPETMEMRIVSRVEPPYPPEAQNAGKQGAAVLDAVIAPDGTVERLRPISGDDLLVRAAEGAVRRWRFEPYQFAGHPIEVETTITVEFKLN